MKSRRQIIRIRWRDLFQLLVGRFEIVLEILQLSQLKYGGSILWLKPNGRFEQFIPPLWIGAQHAANIIFKGAARNGRTGRVVGLGSARSRDNNLQQLPRQSVSERNHI